MIFGRKQEKGSFKGSLMHEYVTWTMGYQVAMEHSLELKCGVYGGEKKVVTSTGFEPVTL